MGDNASTIHCTINCTIRSVGLQRSLSSYRIDGLQIFTKKPMEKLLLGDNKAALTLCCSDTGPWRTRHIRLRAAKPREALAEGSDWRALHLAGGDLVADGGTKPLLGQAFVKFRTLLGMSDSGRVVGVMKRCTVSSMMQSLGKVEFDRVLLAMGGLLISNGVLTVGPIRVLVACLKIWDGTRARGLRPESRPQQDSNKIGKGEAAQCKGLGQSVLCVLMRRRKSLRNWELSAVAMMRCLCMIDCKRLLIRARLWMKRWSRLLKSWRKP